jgi:hypothetical protein
VPGRFRRARISHANVAAALAGHKGVSLGKPGTNGRLDLALYSSFTVRRKRVLWYPDRKFFLLGRVIDPAGF